jgi:hypothetical protein
VIIDSPRIDATTARLIGFISVHAFDDACIPVGEGETYCAGEDGYDFTSRADNLVVESEDLWLAYRDD